MTPDPTERIDNAFKVISRVDRQGAAATARIDGLEKRLDGIDSAIERTSTQTFERFDEMGNDIRDRFADVREDLKDVAVKTSLITGTIVAVVTASVGGLGIWMVKSAVHTQLQPPASQANYTPQTQTITTQQAVFELSRGPSAR